MNKSIVLYLAISLCCAGWSAPKARGQEKRAALGITMSGNTRGGVVVTTVVPLSPAAAAGLKTGDRILAIDGTSVADYRDVTRMINDQKPGARVKLRIDRAGWTKSVPVTLSDASAILRAAPPAVAPAPTPRALLSVQPGSLLWPGDLDDQTPADIDDQHGFGG